MTNSMTNPQDVSKMSEDELFELQVKLENGMKRAGQTRYEKRRQKNIQRGTEADTYYGASIIGEYTDKLAQRIAEFVTEATSGKPGRQHLAVKAIQGLEARTVAMLTIKAVLNNISTQKPLQYVLGSIGALIEDEHKFREIKAQDKQAFEYMVDEAKKRTSYFHKRYYMKRASARKGYEWKSWDARDKVVIGQKLFDMFNELSELVEIITQTEKKNHTIKYIKATPKTLAWIEKRNRAGAYLSPIYEPMIVPPRNWDTPYDGGYLTSFVKPLTMVKVRDKEYMDELAAIDMPIPKDAINILQNVKWAVNTEILEIMETLYENGGGIAGLPIRMEKPEPQKPADFMTNPEAKKEWKIKAAIIHKENLEITSKRASFAMMLDCAVKYSDFMAIYMTYQFDFRSRIYAVPLLNPQGTDYMKGLLHFAEGKPITEEGIKWLAVHGSNCMGVDKVSFEDRVQFILDNEEEILRIAADPYENRGWIAGFAGRTEDNGEPKETDSPWQFLAFCKEWAGVCEQGEDYVSRLAVALDGSCSGLQHFGMALHCEKTGKFVNLIPAEKPQDIYGEVARLVKLRIEHDIIHGTEDGIKEKKDKETGEIHLIPFDGTKKMAQQWAKFGVTRTTCKRSTMVYSYGSREYGFRTQVFDDILRPALRKATNSEGTVDVEKFPFTKDGFMAAGYMAKLIFESVEETVVKAAEAMGWLKEVASLVASEGLPVRWTTPVGFPVKQAYKDTKPRRVETVLMGKRVVLTVNEEEDHIDKAKQASSIAPNFVHALDASHLMLTVVRCHDAGINNLAVIHDSFGTLAADTPKLYEILRKSMLEMYGSMDVFKEFRDEIEGQLMPENIEKLPPLIEKGSLDISQILDSRYCFA